ncbi:hypothetical protein [Azospirillum brasilense]|uniref:Helix-turn-helix domain-containing protein n=1 Tax=Azospirillum brasilense TaxID=192 RepID=A0A235H2Q0_AZOBR|nr:hypothetical protein [Azospirillum brasilense]OYD80119.1 hypothetical protein CHT98_32925 [Azospirillum brasilense]
MGSTTAATIAAFPITGEQRHAWLSDTLATPGLSTYAIALATAVWHHVNLAKGGAWPSVARLAEMGKMSVRRAHDALAELVDAGRLEKHLRPAGADKRRRSYFLRLVSLRPRADVGEKPAPSAGKTANSMHNVQQEHKSSVSLNIAGKPALTVMDGGKEAKPQPIPATPVVATDPDPLRARLLDVLRRRHEDAAVRAIVGATASDNDGQLVLQAVSSWAATCLERHRTALEQAAAALGLRWGGIEDAGTRR